MAEPLSMGTVGLVFMTATVTGAGMETGKRIIAYAADELPKVAEEGWKRHDEATGVLVSEFNKSLNYVMHSN